jgi:hypothetical protein
MYGKLILFCVLLLLFVPNSFSQGSEDQKKKAEEFKKEAIVFLRETATEVGTLRTLENRISFSSEIANLMWFQDEKEARVMFQTVILDFRQLLIQADAQFTVFDVKPTDDSESDYDPFSIDPSNSREKLLKKFRKAIAVRQQITLSIMEHDPEMAYEFFTSTAQAVANATLRKEFENSDVYFEIKLANAIAEKDVDKALEAGRKRLAKGANFELIGLMKKIYEKDADKGIKFGEEIVAKIKSGDAKSVNFYLLSSLLSAGTENLDKLKDKPGKKPMFSESSLREIADLLAQEILKSQDQDGSQFIGYLPQIERFSPARAAQIRQKFKLKITNSTRNTRQNDEEEEESLAPQIAEPLGSGEVSNPNSKTESQEEALEDLQKLGDKQLPKEEREKIIAKARKEISKMKVREQKILALSGLAAQLYKWGDKEAASEIMVDARSLVNLQPRNYKDFLGVWMLASGYAQADPDKAFPILEDAISRLNETIGALIKIGEFIDVDEEIIEGDEVQVGSFGGELTRGVLSMAGVANITIRALANADFARTKALANKFDRAEVRILAKMLVIRAVLGEKETKAAVEVDDVTKPPLPDKP